jgi:hypothetical protein
MDSLKLLRQAINEKQEWSYFLDSTDLINGYKIDRLQVIRYKGEQIYGGHIRGQNNDIYLFQVGEDIKYYHILRIDWKLGVSIPVSNMALNKIQYD